VRGEPQVGPIEGFDPSRTGVSLAGQVRDFDPDRFVVPQLKVQTDRWTWMSLAAARWPPRTPATCRRGGVRDLGLPGRRLGGNEFSQHEIQGLWAKGPRSVGAYQSIAWFYAASTGQVSIRDGYKGPSGVVVSEGAGGLDSIGWARRVARRGTPAVLVGGTEAGVTPYALLCQVTSGRLSTAPRPEDAYKPFDRRANGHAIGEGGAILLLEEADAARARGAEKIWGEVVGYAATHDAHHHEDPAPDATQYTRAIRLALADAGVTPDEVGLVVADGAGVPELDALEAQAITAVFGERGVPVTAPSSWTGRLMAGGSALNVATAPAGDARRAAAPTGNVEEPVEEYGLDLVRETRSRTSTSSSSWPGASGASTAPSCCAGTARRRRRDGAGDRGRGADDPAHADPRGLRGRVRGGLAPGRRRDQPGPGQPAAGADPRRRRPAHLPDHQRLDRPGRRRRLRPEQRRDSLTAALRDLREDAARNTYEVLAVIPGGQGPQEGTA
jgi:minimal PKS chain-length factor (CLF/KS beta)